MKYNKYTARGQVGELYIGKKSLKKLPNLKNSASKKSLNSNGISDGVFVNPFDEYSNDIIDMLPSEYIYAEMFKVLDANEEG